MKIYKVLIKCKPFLVEDTVKESSLKNNFTDDAIKMLIFKEYIQAPKKEFTEADMIDFAYHFKCTELTISVNDYFKKWESIRQ